MKAEIAFDLSVNGVGDWFTLDDPAKGELDNTTYKLAGDVLVDVTDRLRDVSIKRGRSRTLEKFTAGVASLTLDNRDRRFDPLYVSSPYYGQIVPRKQVRISVGGVNLFTGNVEEWEWSYTVDGDAIATPRAIDALATLAQAPVTAGTATAQASGARVTAILDGIGWPVATRSVSTGDATLDADVIEDGTTALAYLQKVETSEQGALFIDASGAVTFRSRTDLENLTTGNTVFGPSGIDFVDYAPASLTEGMTNLSSVTWMGGTAVAGTAVASNLPSQAAYGVFDSAVDTLLADGTQAQDLADWLVNFYGNPKYWVDTITVALHAMDTARSAQVLALELGDVVTVGWTPNGIGSPISQFLVIDAIEHTATPDQHHVTFTLSPTTAGFILDSADFGILDTDQLGY